MNNIEIFDLIKYAIIIICIVIGIYLIRYVKPFLLWIKSGIENGDGKLENKELQIFLFTLLGIFMILAIAFKGVIFPDMAFIGVFGGAGVLYTAKQWSDSKKNSN